MKLFYDFVKFCRFQLESRDIDPVYPVLAYLNNNNNDLEYALWRSILYVAYYNIVSSERVLKYLSKPTEIPDELSRLPMALERRGFRDGSVQQHIASVIKLKKQYGSLMMWLSRGLVYDHKKNWTIIQEHLMEAWGNGRWAAYKTAEILKEVHDFPLIPTDMGNAHSSGPRYGLSLFYPEVDGNQKDVIKTLDQQGDDLLARVQEWGVPISISQLETCLCDFWSLTRGRYYVGHDIDQMLEQINKQMDDTPSTITTALLRARKAVLPSVYLGECHNWSGTDRGRKSHYKRTGEVLCR